MYSNQDVAKVLGSLPIPILTTCAEGFILQANEVALQLFEYTRGELIGEPIEVLIPARYSGEHRQHYQNYVDGATTRPMGKGRDLVGLKKSGLEFPLEVGLTVLPTTPPQYLASIIDLTLRHQAEELSRQREADLEESLKEARRTLEAEVTERTRLEERQRLGRELHDSLSQSLYGIGLGLRTALSKAERNLPPEEALEYCLDLTESALVEMRALLFKLRPKSLENVPLGDVLRSHSQAVTARTKMPIEFQLKGESDRELSFDQKYALYRIVTEALHNCTKHSHARKVVITLQHLPERVCVSVEDDGRGFAEDWVAGHGLSTMKERAEAVGGNLEIDFSEAGTTVSARVPVLA